MCTTRTGLEEFCKYSWWRKAILVHQLDCSRLVHALHGPGIDTRISISPVCNQTQVKIGLCERKCCVSLARWSLNYENGFVLPKLTHLSLALCRSVFRVFMPPLLPTQAAEEIWDACSQSAAWRSLDQASGTAGRRNRNTSDKAAWALSFNYLYLFINLYLFI